MSNETRRVAGVNPKAIKEASLLDDGFFESADYVFAADLVKKTSAVVILTDIKRCFEPSIRKEWPKFDSGRTEDGEIDYTCNNPDWTKTLSGKRTVWVSYFDTHVLRAPKSMAITAQIENLRDQAKGEGGKVKKAQLLEYDSDIKTLETKLSSYKQTYRKAVKLLQQEERAAALYPEMKMSYRKDSDGNIKQCAEPIMCFPQELPLEGVNFTVTQFMSLDFEVEGLSEETDPQKRWDLLLSTMTREPPEGDEEDEDNINVNNWKRFETSSASTLHLLEQGQFTTLLYGRLDKAKEISTHADLIKTLVELSVEYNAIAQHLKAPRKGGKGSLYEQAMAEEENVTAEAEVIAAA